MSNRRKPMRIVCIGPERVGKTVICNVLAENGLENYGDYDPTEHVRILEFSLTLIGEGERDILLWDCGGRDAYDKQWNVVAYKCDGVLLVLSPDRITTNDRHTKIYDYFVKNRESAEVLVVNNSLPGVPRKTMRDGQDAVYNGHTVVDVDPHDASALKETFEEFIKGLLKYKNSQQE